jgi:hypothetical protein
MVFMVNKIKRLDILNAADLGVINTTQISGAYETDHDLLNINLMC